MKIVAWIMAREPSIVAAELGALVRLIALAGYNAAKIRQVPQRW